MGLGSPGPEHLSLSSPGRGGVRALPPRAPRTSLCLEKGAFPGRLGVNRHELAGSVCFPQLTDLSCVCVFLVWSPQSVISCASVADKSPEDAYGAASVLARCLCGSCLSCAVFIRWLFTI